jgi:hypothetical protein
MTNNDSLRAHLDTLKKKHRELDEQIINLTKTHITEDVRRLKTEKLWLKDEIHRVEHQLESSSINGHS